jgi:DNA-binding NarL/FixJ family response regulator
MLRILLIDDQLLFREAMRRLIERTCEFELVGDSDDSSRVTALIESLRPDVLVLDHDLDAARGIDVARDVRRSHIDLPILMLSMHLDDHFAIAALQSGITGYAVKTQPFAEVCDALRVTARGERYLAPRISRRAVEEHLAMRTQSGSSGPLSVLTSREEQVFALLVGGLGNGRIASQLSISSRTVEAHRARIREKLGVHSTAELVRFAALHGLLPRSAPAAPLPPKLAQYPVGCTT